VPSREDVETYIKKKEEKERLQEEGTEDSKVPCIRSIRYYLI